MHLNRSIELNNYAMKKLIVRNLLILLLLQASGTFAQSSQEPGLEERKAARQESKAKLEAQKAVVHKEKEVLSTSDFGRK